MVWLSGVELLVVGPSVVGLSVVAPSLFGLSVVGPSVVGGRWISSRTLQLFVSQHFARQEVIVTLKGNEDNLLCASKQTRSCVVVQLKREESEEF